MEPIETSGDYFMPTPSDTLRPSPTTGFTYLALGDSYTIGEGVPVKDRWPIQLAGRLDENRIEVKPPRIIAQTGWTTGELLLALNQAQITEQYNLVSLLIGVNNQYRNGDLEFFTNTFNELLDKSIGYAGGNPMNVIVLSIPDYGVTPFGRNRNPEKIAREIDEYNRISKIACERKNISYFSITELTRLYTGVDYIASDQLHPSGKMYELWVNAIILDVERKLKAQIQ
ncbi:MAG: SGNH/GDSL hydrolase family protein [Cyclobacteriaceae bacterium]|nr:SGNH/GDSL hydrolase family protein [Cyclobacteriaceae bacterium]